MVAPGILESVQHMGHCAGPVVLPVPGLPVRDLCSGGKSAWMLMPRRAASTISSAATSRMRLLNWPQPNEAVVGPVQRFADAGLGAEGAAVLRELGKVAYTSTSCPLARASWRRIAPITPR